MTHLNVAGAYVAGRVIALFDSPLASLRSGAFAALDVDSPAATDPAFWSALLESPYDDVRANLVTTAQARANAAGRRERSAGAAVADRAAQHPPRRAGEAVGASADQPADHDSSPNRPATLLPVLAVAIRSVRGPEARHGLAAIVAAVERVPSLEPHRRAIPPRAAARCTGGGGDDPELRLRRPQRRRRSRRRCGRSASRRTWRASRSRSTRS